MDDKELKKILEKIRKEHLKSKKCFFKRMFSKKEKSEEKVN